MAFASFAELIAMDGHGGFVWSAWGISAAVLIALVLLPLRRHRRLLAEAGQRAGQQS